MNQYVMAYNAVDSLKTPEFLYGENRVQALQTRFPGKQIRELSESQKDNTNVILMHRYKAPYNHKSKKLRTQMLFQVV
jgi:hypothetical protein